MYTFKATDFFSDDEMISVSPLIAATDEKQHRHEFIELVYIFSGNGEHHIDNHILSVTKGDFLFINLNKTHAFSAKGEMVYVNCLIKPEFLNSPLLPPNLRTGLFSLSLFDNFDQDSDPQRCIFRFDGAEQNELHNVVTAMIREATDKNQGYQEALAGYLNLIFIKMSRSLASSIHPSKKNLDQDILRYVNEHCFQKLSLNQLAKRYFYHPAYFSHKFRELCGTSLSAYIKERRIKEAIRLLKESTLTIEEIYLSIGYSEKTQFYAAFKEFTGKTPKQLRIENNI